MVKLIQATELLPGWGPWYQRCLGPGSAAGLGQKKKVSSQLPITWVTPPPPFPDYTTGPYRGMLLPLPAYPDSGKERRREAGNTRAQTRRKEETGDAAESEEMAPASSIYICLNIYSFFLSFSPQSPWPLLDCAPSAYRAPGHL